MLKKKCLSQARSTDKLRTTIGITKSEICLQKLSRSPISYGQCSVSTVFSCDTGTQDRGNRAGLREGKRVRTAIGRSCTFSMLWVGEGVYCPFTHNAKSPAPPSEQFNSPLSPQSYVTVGLKGCHSAICLVDWWTRDQIIDICILGFWSWYWKRYYILFICVTLNSCFPVYCPWQGKRDIKNNNNKMFWEFVFMIINMSGEKQFNIVFNFHIYICSVNWLSFTVKIR